MDSSCHRPPSETETIEIYRNDVRQTVDYVFTHRKGSYDVLLGNILKTMLETNHYRAEDNSLIYALYSLIDIDVSCFWVVLRDALSELREDREKILKELLLLIIKYCSIPFICFRICINYHLSYETYVDLYVAVMSVDTKRENEEFLFIWQKLEFAAIYYKLGNPWCMELQSACQKHDNKKINQLIADLNHKKKILYAIN
jgi:hypothetical protein